MASIEEGSTNKELLSDGAFRWDMSNVPPFADDRSRNVKSKEALRGLTARRAANIALEAIRSVAGPDVAE